MPLVDHVSTGGGTTLPPALPTSATSNSAAAQVRSDIVRTKTYTSHDNLRRSRWDAGATTYGPLGRVAITVAVVGGIAFAVLYGAAIVAGTLGRFALVFTVPVLGVPLAIGGMRMLRDVWRKEEVETRGPSHVSGSSLAVQGIREMRPATNSVLPGDATTVDGPSLPETGSGYACTHCHFLLPAAGARWCPRCKEPTTHAEFVLSPEASLARDVKEVSLQSEPPEATRWAGTPTTLGPIGRLLGTAAVLLAIGVGTLFVSGARWTMWMVPRWAQAERVSEAVTTATLTWYLLLMVSYSLVALAVIWRRGYLSPDAAAARQDWQPSGGKLGTGWKVALTGMLIIAPIYFFPGSLATFALVPSLFIIIGLWKSATSD